MKRVLALVVLAVVVLFITSCGEDKQTTIITPKISKPSVTDDVKIVKSQSTDEPEEEHIEVICGDDRCDNFEHKSTTNRYACSYGAVKSNKLDCNVEIVEGEMITTENYFTCPDDCNKDCNIDLDVDVCENSKGRLKITINNRDEIHSYLLHFLGEGGAIEHYVVYGYPYDMDADNLRKLLGNIESISILPSIQNSDGTISDCGQNMVEITKIKDC